MAQTTALNQALELFRTRKAGIEHVLETCPNYPRDGDTIIQSFTLLDDCIETLKYLLETERKQIESAYTIGNNEAEFGDTFGSAYFDSNDYFTQTYGNG